ncbi:hypothetical protein BK126_26335 [Paenibacillus sp. FSL H7-0326]|uniref:hypothetical protein n=1 Tax=Paenibacillus sp. FSL H7-0326 TaxID=1921144 RepID=UPI00096E5421|nr:hypothetical protein [Paenibacillus sp. FSL H7-0326]OMC63714.1 hypothetical protein BK126_26335 [Paenibacillus sp. FSL H7-0326]
MIVAFAAPVHGQPGTTSNQMATSTMLGIDYHFHLLITHTHLQLSTLERGYAKTIEIDEIRELNRGMDGLLRLTDSYMLKPENIRDNAMSVVRGRLDLMPGMLSGKHEELLRVLPSLLNHYRTAYDLMFVDIPSGIQNESSKMVINKSNVVVVNLNQNKTVLDSFFNNTEWQEVLKDKEVVYCIGNYDRQSKLSKERIAREYKIPVKKIGVVPYNIRFRDAQNDRDIIDYLLRARNIEKKFMKFDEEVYFIESVRHLGSMLLDVLQMRPIKEAEEIYA